MTLDEFFDIGRVAYITGNVQEALAAKQALEKVVESANSAQQLKAEIAAFATQMRSTPTSDVVAYWHEIYTKLRQLSAV